jgi:hypothetical protein
LCFLFSVPPFRLCNHLIFVSVFIV